MLDSIFKQDEYSEFILKAVLLNDESLEIYNVYLFEPNEKLLFFYTTDQFGANGLINIKAQQNSFSGIRPSIYHTFMHAILFMQATIECVYVYDYIDEIYYCNVRLRREVGECDINCKLTDALCLAQLFDAKIYISHAICESLCIKVTKELLEESLNGDLN